MIGAILNIFMVRMLRRSATRRKSPWRCWSGSSKPAAIPATWCWTRSAGCGTTIDAAEKLGRDWIGIDVTQLAISLIKNRLQDTYGPRMKFDFRKGRFTPVPRPNLGTAALVSREGQG